MKNLQVLLVEQVLCKKDYKKKHGFCRASKKYFSGSD